MKNTKSESKELMIVPKFNWTKYLHIAIIVLGSIFILFPSNAKSIVISPSSVYDF